MADTVPLSEDQRAQYEALLSGAPPEVLGYGLALLSVKELATGKDRAMVVTVVDGGDGSVQLAPMALLLEEADLDLYEPQDGFEVVDSRG